MIKDKRIDNDFKLGMISFTKNNKRNPWYPHTKRMVTDFVNKIAG